MNAKMSVYFHLGRRLHITNYVPILDMVTLVVKFPREGYKIRQIVGQKSSYSKKNVAFCEET